MSKVRTSGKLYNGRVKQRAQGTNSARSKTGCGWLQLRGWSREPVKGGSIPCQLLQDRHAQALSQVGSPKPRHSRLPCTVVWRVKQSCAGLLH